MAAGNWFVVHTYSGYENKVKIDIEKTIENRNLQDQIFEVAVPMQTVTEVKDGRTKQSEKKMFPGYVLVNMIMNDDTWYVIRNTRGVTGFVGPGSKPVPLSEEEIKFLFTEKTTMTIEYKVGDTVVATAGVWKDRTGKIKSIDEKHQKVTINIELFERVTPVELDFTEVKLAK